MYYGSTQNDIPRQRQGVHNLDSRNPFEVDRLCGGTQQLLRHIDKFFRGYGYATEPEYTTPSADEKQSGTDTKAVDNRELLTQSHTSMGFKSPTSITDCNLVKESEKNLISITDRIVLADDCRSMLTLLHTAMDFKSPTSIDRLPTLPRVKGLHRKLHTNKNMQVAAFRCYSSKNSYLSASNNYFKSLLFLILYLRISPGESYDNLNDAVIQSIISTYMEQVYVKTPVSNIETIDFKIIKSLEEQIKEHKISVVTINLEMARPPETTHRKF